MAETDKLENQYKVSLRVATDPGQLSNSDGIRDIRNRIVSFDVSPDVTENRNINYKTLDPLHMPGQIFVYSGTSSRTFQLSNIKLISRTVKEATKNMQRLHQLRGWAMPYFGNSSTLSFQNNRYRKYNKDNDYTPNFSEMTEEERNEEAQNLGMELKGGPPDVLLLTAYAPRGEYAEIGRNSVRRRISATNIHNVPVVMTNLTIPYTSDVDYIPTENGQPFPRMMTIDIQLSETHSPQEYNKFSLHDYRQGILVNF